MAVGDGVAQRDDGCGAGRCFDVNFGKLKPMVDLTGIGQSRSGGCVTMHVPGSGARSGMTGFPQGSSVKVEGYGEIGEGGNGEGDRVRDKLCVGWDGDIGGSGEGERAVALRIDSG